LPDEPGARPRGQRLSLAATDAVPPLEPERLQQSEPELAHRRIGGRRVPEPAERDLADDGDGCGVQQLAHPRSDQRHPDDDAPGFVDHHPRPPRVVVAVERRPCDLADLVVDRPHPQAASPRSSVSPTAATSGSVKITWGTAPWSALAAWGVHGAGPPDSARPVARATIASPPTRAWYFPMCVRSARWFTSPAA